MKLCGETSIQVKTLSSVWDGVKFITFPVNYCVLYDSQHAYAYLPNGKSNKDKPDLSLVIENFSKLMVVDEDLQLSVVETVSSPIYSMVSKVK